MLNGQSPHRSRSKTQGPRLLPRRWFVGLGEAQEAVWFPSLRQLTAQPDSGRPSGRTGEREMIQLQGSRGEHAVISFHKDSLVLNVYRNVGSTWLKCSIYEGKRRQGRQRPGPSRGRAWDSLQNTWAVFMEQRDHHCRGTAVSTCSQVHVFTPRSASLTGLP